MLQYYKEGFLLTIKNLRVYFIVLFLSFFEQIASFAYTEMDATQGTLLLLLISLVFFVFGTGYVYTVPIIFEKTINKQKISYKSIALSSLRLGRKLFLWIMAYLFAEILLITLLAQVLSFFTETVQAIKIVRSLINLGYMLATLGIIHTVYYSLGSPSFNDALKKSVSFFFRNLRFLSPMIIFFLHYPVLGNFLKENPNDSLLLSAAYSIVTVLIITAFTATIVVYYKDKIETKSEVVYDISDFKKQ